MISMSARKPSKDTLDKVVALAPLVALGRSTSAHRHKPEALRTYFENDKFKPAAAMKRLLEPDDHSAGERFLLSIATGKWMQAPHDVRWVKTQLLRAVIFARHRYLGKSGFSRRQDIERHLLLLIDPKLEWLRDAIDFLGGEKALATARENDEPANATTTYFKQAGHVANLLKIAHYHALHLKSVDNRYAVPSIKKSIAAYVEILKYRRKSSTMEKSQLLKATTLRDRVWIERRETAGWCYAAASFFLPSGNSLLDMIGKDAYPDGDASRTWILALARRVQFVQKSIYPLMPSQLTQHLPITDLPDAIASLPIPLPTFSDPEVEIIRKNATDQRSSRGAINLTKTEI